MKSRLFRSEESEREHQKESQRDAEIVFNNPMEVTEHLDTDVYIRMRKSQIELSNSILTMHTFKGTPIDNEQKEQIKAYILQLEEEIRGLKKI